MAVVTFVALWILVQTWWGLKVHQVSCNQKTPVYKYAYTGAGISLPFAWFAWWHPIVLLSLFAAWYMINIDAWINLGTDDEPDLQDARAMHKSKIKNWILVAFIILVNTIVIHQNLLSCVSTIMTFLNGPAR